MTNFTARKIEARKTAAEESIKAITDGLKNTERGLLLSVLEGKSVTNYSTATSGKGFGTYWENKRLSLRAYRNAAKALVKKGLVSVAYTGPSRHAYCYGTDEEGEIGAGWHFYRSTYYLRGISNDASTSHNIVDVTDTQLAAAFLSDMSNEDLMRGAHENHFYEAFYFVASPDLLAHHATYKDAHEALRNIERIHALDERIGEAEGITVTTEDEVKALLIEAINSHDLRTIEQEVRSILDNAVSPEDAERMTNRAAELRATREKVAEKVEAYLAA